MVERDWSVYVDDCPANVFKSYARAVKFAWQASGGRAPVGALPPSPKAVEWFNAFLARRANAAQEVEDDKNPEFWK